MARMSRDTFLQTIQSRAARIAIGPSTVRGPGNGGVVPAARAFLCKLDLRRFSGITKEPAFQRALDACTEELRLALPINARHWGLARKGLNIFLRDCLCTVYLNEAFRLQSAEALYELPLDSITAQHLRGTAGAVLPRFPASVMSRLN